MDSTTTKSEASGEALYQQFSALQGAERIAFYRANQDALDAYARAVVDAEKKAQLKAAEERSRAFYHHES